jgi:hypothetical protein
MGSKGTEVAGRVSEAYKGIEGFYVLNPQGELGYFSEDGQRLVRESFDGTNQAPAPPDPDKVESFNSELRRSSEGFPPGEDKELGYLLPVDDEHVWNTATLILHDHIARELKDAFDRDIKLGRMSLAEGDRKIRDITLERGLHRGFEDLLNHIGSFGTHTFFPVLYFRPSQRSVPTGAATQPFRVLNLLSLIQGTGRFSDLLARMRKNLQERGALNKASRVEHRFKLQDEVD